MATSAGTIKVNLCLKGFIVALECREQNARERLKMLILKSQTSVIKP